MLGGGDTQTLLDVKKFNFMHLQNFQAGDMHPTGMI